ncbi:MAG: cation transporter [Chloroflexi bacterium]|nr:MAG: cation transporter [Chloroflexota bacterium]
MERARTAGSGLRLALGLTLAVLVVELAGGLLSHSLALLADAGHVLTDVFALGLAWFAIEQSKRPADRHRSYGYQRVGILAALVNAAALIVIVLAIGFEAVRRLMTPEPVQGGAVIATALAAIAINALVIVTLRGGSQNLNLRAALLHVTGDVASSAGVVVAGAVILLTGWLYIDPLLSLGIAVFIAYSAWGIVRETVNLLMEGTPPEIDLGAVTSEISGTSLVTGVHDLHAEHVVRDLETRLCDRFAIGHTTIQVESCHPCGEIHHGAGEHNHPHVTLTFSARPAHPRAAGSSAPPL